MNRELHKYSMESLYTIAGFTKQAHSDYAQHIRENEHLTRIVEDIIINVRQIHSQMGLRKMWYMVHPDKIGRDFFIDTGVELGYEIPKPINYQRTTYSTRSNLYGNLTANLPITTINRVWVSDITYFFIGNIIYYLTFIEDVYSRRIIGWTASKTLQADASCTALKRALKTRSGMDISNVIHHSDKGVQYTSNLYLNILNKHNISISLCDIVYENSHIERLNGIIKNEYLYHSNIKTFKQLLTELNKSVYYYNNLRPHYSLGLLTPVEFEKKLSEIPVTERQTLIIWSDNKIKRPIQFEMFD